MQVSKERPKDRWFAVAEQWHQQGYRFAIVTVLQTIGSAPQPVGTQMIVREDCHVEGAISGGCVESAVIDRAIAVIQSLRAQDITFGVADDTAWSVGLSCGGTIRVLIEPHPLMLPHLQPLWKQFHEVVHRQQGAVWVIQLLPQSGPVGYALWQPQQGWKAQWGTVGTTQLDAVLPMVYRQRRSQLIALGQGECFLLVVPPPSQLLIIGAGFPAVDLLVFARRLGMSTILIDPRKVFADPQRFAVPPDQLFHQWPSTVLPMLSLTEETYAVILSHDPKIDDDALRILLRSPVRYIGALGSRKTHRKRQERLRQQGFTDEEIQRISAPIGIPIGAVTPAEIAVSIMAEIIRVRYGQSLTDPPSK